MPLAADKPTLSVFAKDKKIILANAARDFDIFIILQELPKRISTAEEAEILTLLCKVHELEIGKVYARKFPLCG